MDVISLRRFFHQHPEVGFTEFLTASRVVEIMEKLGYEVSYGDEAMDSKSRRGVPTDEELAFAYQRAIDNGANPKILEKMKGGLTGVIGVLHGKKPGPTIAFRVDMDALPITESAEGNHFPQAQGFRSTFAGNMHACGHDAHTAIGLAFAEKMAQKAFAGTLKLIFQPAEEGGRGAYSMVSRGCVDDVDKLYALHVDVGSPSGAITGGSKGWLATRKISIKFHGIPSHAGGSPEVGRNALLAAATAVLNIHAIPRFSSSITRVNVGVLESGTAINIIPHYAKMLVETRSTCGADNMELFRRVENICNNAAMMHEVKCEIEVIGEGTTITCDEEMIANVLEEAQKIEGFSEFARYNTSEGLGSEDSSLLFQRVQEHGGQGTYMLIGTHGTVFPHNEKFDIDESVLPLGVKLLERLAVRDLQAK